MRDPHLVYPAGRYGAALLVMRACAGLPLLRLASQTAERSLWASLPLLALSLALLVGVWTRTCAAAGATVLVAAGASNGGLLGTAAALLGADAAALSLMGAGAFSLDSRFFGRRVITLDD